jgi:hypothetical protein
VKRFLVILFFFAIGSFLFSQAIIENWEFTWTLYDVNDFRIEITKTDDTLYTYLFSNLSGVKINAEDAQLLGQGLLTAEIEFSKMVAAGAEISKSLKPSKNLTLNLSYSPVDGKSLILDKDDSYFSLSIDPKIIKTISPILSSISEKMKLVNDRIKPNT